MEQTTDGFKIAEEDLAIRGPGEFMGIRQSGLPDFRVANILRDGQILNEAKTDAFELIEKDPFLRKQSTPCSKPFFCTNGRGVSNWRKRDSRTLLLHHEPLHILKCARFL